MSAADDKSARLLKVGQILRDARETRKLSLRRLSERTGVSVAYLCDVEFGRRSFSAARLREIAAALGMAPSDRVRLFLTAKMTPPAVAARVVKSPKTWAYDPKALLALAQELNKYKDKLPKSAAAMLEVALTEVEW